MIKEAVLSFLAIVLPVLSIHAQEKSPLGLYHLDEIIQRDGKRMLPNYTQYKYFNEKGEWQVSLKENNLDENLSKSFFIFLNHRLSKYTDHLSDTDSIGWQIYPIDKQKLLYRWYNANLKNNTYFPYKQNIDEIYSHVNDSYDLLYNAFELIQMKLGEHESAIQGVWKLRGIQSKSCPTSQFWVQAPLKDTYRIFSDHYDLTFIIENNDPVPAAWMNIRKFRHLSDNAFNGANGTSAVHWFDYKTISVTEVDKNGHLIVQIWDKCGLPSNFQEMFGTKIPILKKDLTPYLTSTFTAKYGEKPDSIKAAFEGYMFLTAHNEANNAIYPLLMEGGFEKEYKEMKAAILNKILQGQVSMEEAAARYVFWFTRHFDRHTRLENSATYDKLVESSFINYHTLIKEYNPQPVACKIDSETYFVRIPSCSGEYPTMAWINNKVKAFKRSGCPYLIIDVRGNSGGNDHIGLPFYTMFGDCGWKEDVRHLFRNSLDNHNMINRLLAIFEIQQNSWEIVNKIEAMASEDHDSPFFDFLLYKKGTDVQMPQVKRGAVIMDALTASAGESFIAYVKRHSMTHAKVYGKDNSAGFEKTGNCSYVRLPHSNLKFFYPMTAEESIKRTCKMHNLGWAPDVVIPLPYPEKLTDNIDEWVLWVAKQLKKR